MTPIQDQAISGFKSGLNCAQAVFTAFSDKYKIDRDVALSLSCGFGAGMGRLQETCGAVTGAFITIGLHAGSLYQDNKDRKENSYAMIREFDQQFKKIHGTCKCQELIKVDLKTPEGQKIFHDYHLNEVVCEKCISAAVKILGDMLE